MNLKDRKAILEIIKAALKEDVGKGDVTARLCVKKGKYVKAKLIFKETGIVCGLDIVRSIFKTVDRNIDFRPQIKEGRKVSKGKAIALIVGPAGSILTSERVVLNFLGLLSGIATHTRKFVDRVKTSGVKIMDTRKTYPGLRILEKYAVKVGGGYNHRMNLDKMVLVKDNHLKAQGRGMITPYLIKKIKQKIPSAMQIEIEVNNLREFRQALKARPDIIMLDNMNIKTIKRAVHLKKDHKIKLEASGNIDLKNVKKIARTGVDMISIGSLTHSVKSADVSLEIL